jgi:tRNA nucleotidyltransferase (CCA-adding enzyme)
LEDRPYPQAEYVRRARDAAAAAQLSDEERVGLQGPAIGARIRAKRLEAVTRVKAEFAGQVS